MPDDTEAARLARQRDHDLIEQGRSQERMNGRVTSLEEHAKSVNGQIKRMGELQSEMNGKLTKVVDDIDDRAKSDARGDQKRMSKWTIISIVSGIVLASCVFVVSLLTLLLETK